jgi:hypothetical protein
MADLITGVTSTQQDTATQLANLIDDIIAEHVNGPNAAIVAIENELGATVLALVLLSREEQLYWGRTEVFVWR